MASCRVIVRACQSLPDFLDEAGTNSCCAWVLRWMSPERTCLPPQQCSAPDQEQDGPSGLGDLSCPRSLRLHARLECACALVSWGFHPNSPGCQGGKTLNPKEKNPWDSMGVRL